MIKSFKAIIALAFVGNCQVNAQQDVFLKSDPKLIDGDNLDGEQWPLKCSSSLDVEDAMQDIDLTDKVYVYTGGDGNIATQAVTALVKANATVVMACRDAGKCQPVKESILSKTGGNGAIEIALLDLSSISSIQKFAEQAMKLHPKIDGLINSAGTYSNHTSKDGFLLTMEVNVMGPALLTDMLLPALQGGRVVNVAAATYGLDISNYTVEKLRDMTKNADDNDFQLSKLLLIHHAKELALREENVTVFSVNPGYAVEVPYVPQWLLRHLPPSLMPAGPAQRMKPACNTNFKGLASCPETYSEAATVVTLAAAMPGLERFSGSYLDFDTKIVDENHIFGPYEQRDSTCIPRDPPYMDDQLRSDWYDEMLKLMAPKPDDKSWEQAYPKM